MKPATPKARDLRAKLEALVEAGINGEKVAAKIKLERLISRFDWTAPDTRTADLFAGKFQPAQTALPVRQFTAETFDFAPSVKWAIEHATGIRCAFRDCQLVAEATPRTAAKLSGIAGTIAESFVALWTQFHKAGARPDDQGIFVMGLYDGMMNEVRPALLPSRTAKDARQPKAKKRALAAPAGLALHPYSVAAQLGQRIRFSVPLDLITQELNQAITKQLEEAA